MVFKGILEFLLLAIVVFSIVVCHWFSMYTSLPAASTVRDSIWYAPPTPTIVPESLVMSGKSASSKGITRKNTSTTVSERPPRTYTRLHTKEKKKPRRTKNTASSSSSATNNVALGDVVSTPSTLLTNTSDTTFSSLPEGSAYPANALVPPPSTLLEPTSFIRQAEIKPLLITTESRNHKRFHYLDHVPEYYSSIHGGQLPTPLYSVPDPPYGDKIHTSVKDLLNPLIGNMVHNRASKQDVISVTMPIHHLILWLPLLHHGYNSTKHWRSLFLHHHQGIGWSQVASAIRTFYHQPLDALESAAMLREANQASCLCIAVHLKQKMQRGGSVMLADAICDGGDIIQPVVRVASIDIYTGVSFKGTDHAPTFKEQYVAVISMHSVETCLAPPLRAYLDSHRVTTLDQVLSEPVPGILPVRKQRSRQETQQNPVVKGGGGGKMPRQSKQLLDHVNKPY